MDDKTLLLLADKLQQAFVNLNYNEAIAIAGAVQVAAVEARYVLEFGRKGLDDLHSAVVGICSQSHETNS